ncbi:MAG: PQQ-like beta-propeller repeat protein [Pirellulales bacterium]|nr:PQQ-like beta-propeller repeat protein [Pirellulales bacterium]
MFLAVLTAANAASAETLDRWPGFLGAGVDASAAIDVPLHWSPNENVAWKCELAGYGQSCPVIWNGVAYVTTVSGPMKESNHVTAIDLASGQVRWTKSLDASSRAKRDIWHSQAAPTPVIDETGLYVYFESGDVVALSQQGVIRWEKSLTKQFGEPKNRFCLASSPVLFGNSIIILIDDDGGPSYLIALAKADGEQIWKTDRKGCASWSSPALVTIGNRQHLVCSSGSIRGYDPKNGDELWSFEQVTGNTIATPTVCSPGKFLIGASPGANGEGAAGVKQSNFAMAVETVDGKPQPRVLWRNEKCYPSYSSPIAHRGIAYWINPSGVVYGFDVETGKQIFAERTKQGCWATPIGIGERVYLFGKSGLTTVIAAGPKFQMLAENQLWDPDQVQVDPVNKIETEKVENKQLATYFGGVKQYGAAVVDGKLLIRTGSTLYCIIERPQPLN